MEKLSSEQLEAVIRCNNSFMCLSEFKSRLESEGLIKEEIKELTVEQIEKELGYSIKIVK